ncbi:hypothetical protein R6Q59_022027 [Mikania micrantha]
MVFRIFSKRGCSKIRAKNHPEVEVANVPGTGNRNRSYPNRWVRAVPDFQRNWNRNRKTRNWFHPQTGHTRTGTGKKPVRTRNRLEPEPEPVPKKTRFGHLYPEVHVVPPSSVSVHPEVHVINLLET